MVVIECPHCEEHIELDDDASGMFECPHCDGEFEWGDDETDSEVFQNYSHIDHDHFLANPIAKIAVGSTFASILGLVGVFAGIGPILVGVFFSDLGAGGLGGVFIMIGLFLMLIGAAGIALGILIAKGKLWALVTGFVISIMGTFLQIIGWAASEDECAEIDVMTLQCTETLSPPFPFFGVFIFLLLATSTGALLFHPSGRSEFR